jgi:hypothetical protein
LGTGRGRDAEGDRQPGSGDNIRRAPLYLLDFTIRWNGLDVARKQEFLYDAWALREFADDASEDSEVREMRPYLA